MRIVHFGIIGLLILQLTGCAAAFLAPALVSTAVGMAQFSAEAEKAKVEAQKEDRQRMMASLPAGVTVAKGPYRNAAGEAEFQDANGTCWTWDGQIWCARGNTVAAAPQTAKQ